MLKSTPVVKATAVQFFIGYVRLDQFSTNKLNEVNCVRYSLEPNVRHLSSLEPNVAKTTVLATGVDTSMMERRVTSTARDKLR